MGKLSIKNFYSYAMVMVSTWYTGQLTLNTAFKLDVILVYT